MSRHGNEHRGQPVSTTSREVPPHCLSFKRDVRCCGMTTSCTLRRTCRTATSGQQSNNEMPQSTTTTILRSLSIADGDTHEYYEIEINAFGTILDQLLTKPYRDGGTAVTAWDIGGLQSAVQIWGTLNNPLDEDEGWTVEMALPWPVLKECAHRPVPPKAGDYWRVNFSRVQWDESGKSGKATGSRSRTWCWSPQGTSTMHHPERWGYVRFSGDTPNGSRPPPSAPRYAEGLRLLREIYDEQRRFYDASGRYAADIDTLGITHRLLQNFLWPPSMTATDRWFEAYVEEVEDLDGDGEIDRWYVRQDSKTWKE